MRLLKALSLFLVLSILAVSCSREKDLFSSRLYHRMVSKYNILFNGEQALLKARTTLKTQHKDDFDKILPIYIEGDERTISSVKPDLEKAIEKGTKTIKEHSMMIENKQKNNYIDDAYLLIGKARYYNQEYMLALETFNYIIQEFREPKIRAEAELWAAKTETALDNHLAAQDRFDKLYSDKQLSKYLDADVYGAFAALEIKKDRYLNAYQLLIQGAEKTSKKEEEVRWLYICGQLQASLGNDYDASQLFLRVIKKGPPYELLFNAQLSRARNYDVDLMDPSEAYDELEKMLRDDKNYDNRDRIYYVMAEVAQKLDELEERDGFLKKSIRVSTQNQKQKGLSYLWLAEIRFDDRKYEDAQAYYDSCSQFLPKDHPKYARVEVFKKSLGRLVENLNTIALQDSLQAIAALSPKQQLVKAEAIIEAIKEAEEAAKEAENRALDNLAFNAANGGGEMGGLAGVGAANQQFYFYNPGIRSAGVSTFANRWGNRKLEDNWRRSDKSISAADPSLANENANSPEGEGEEEKLDPKYDPKTYLAKVPNDSSSMLESHRLIQEALLDNALLYKEEIKDLVAAAASVDDLLNRYPQFKGRARAWYILYRVYVLVPDEALSAKYKNLILSTYPESEYAYLILNEGKEKEAVDESAAKQAYAAAFLKYEAKDYRRALRASESAIEQFSDSHFGAKLLLLKAYCQGALQQKDEIIKSLQGVLQAYPATEEAAQAKVILDAINKNSPDPEKGNKAKASTYRTDFSAMHRYILVVPNGKANGNQLSIKLSDFNSKYYPNDRLNAKSILMGRDQQVIMVSGLANKERALNYLNTLNNEKALEQLLLSVDYKQFVISNANFTDFYKKQDIEGYQIFYQEHYQKKGK